jgi:23S rRNA pseudouridine1911/1915/1917 synthase
MRLTLQIPETGERLDRCLAALLPDYSRTYLHQLIAAGRVTQAGKVLKPSWKPRVESAVEIDMPEPEMTQIQPESIALAVIYEDEWLLAVNKPQGMVVHPAAGHRSGTLVNALLAHCDGQLSDLNGVIRPGIVHRIDKDTSGLLLVVKDNRIHADISDKIRRHEVTRAYQAIVHGVLQAPSGTIDAPIGRDPRRRQRMAVVADGKPARSHFVVHKILNGATWLDVRLETGRTHQIRVHLQYIGHPVIGDPVYAGNRPAHGLAGQALHAGALEFTHPVTGERLHLTCPLPQSFTDLAERLT